MKSSRSLEAQGRLRGVGVGAFLFFPSAKPRARAKLDDPWKRRVKRADRERLCSKRPERTAGRDDQETIPACTLPVEMQRRKHRNCLKKLRIESLYDPYTQKS